MTPVIASYVTLGCLGLSFGFANYMTRVYFYCKTDVWKIRCTAVLVLTLLSIITAAATSWVWMPKSGLPHVLFAFVFLLVALILAAGGIAYGVYVAFKHNGYRILHR